jgi:hypothetical protein
LVNGSWRSLVARCLQASAVLVCLVWLPGQAQVEERVELNGEPEIDTLVRQLFAVIESMSDYRAREVPPLFRVPQRVLEAKVCELPCNVRAAYLPREGIYLAGNLDPLREPLDRAALLHELVHFLQQGHPKFATLTGCSRERAKEQEAYAMQNAYLTALGRAERVGFYAGGFDCVGEAAARSP